MGLKTVKELAYSGDYNNIENALMSGLPNEVDFALNVCTLLSNEGRHTIRLDKCPRLLKIMFAHIGIFEDGKFGI
jgi:AT-rich interactive domain-containing protein 2